MEVIEEIFNVAKKRPTGTLQTLAVLSKPVVYVDLEDYVGFILPSRYTKISSGYWKSNLVLSAVLLRTSKQL